MSKRAVVIVFLVFVMAFLQLGIAQKAEVEVPLDEIKPSCYGKIDMSETEFLLSEVGKECVTEEWLKENANDSVEVETKTREGQGELPDNTKFRTLDDIWALGSRNSGYSKDKEFFEVNHISYLGGNMEYVYKNLGSYGNEIRNNNSLLLFNPLSESFSVLEEWPNEFQQFFPFKLDELTNYHPPYIWFKETSEGRLRGILVANSEARILELVGDISGNKVPVGIPVGYKGGTFHPKPGIS